MKKILLVILLIGFGFFLTGCGDVQNEYYEVHIIVVNDLLFRYVNPDEGKDTISIKYMDNEDSQFIYLYQPIDGIEFSYDHFFTTINARFITTDRRTGKHYILSSDEINASVQQFYIEKQAWETDHQ